MNLSVTHTTESLFFCFVFLFHFTVGTPQEGDTRLVNGAHDCQGRVEVFARGEWGTVCSDWFDMREAYVVCGQLGCGRARAAISGARFGPGTGRIWLDNLLCRGTESNLLQCRHPGLGSHNCKHSYDASVFCDPGKHRK